MPPKTLFGPLLARLWRRYWKDRRFKLILLIQRGWLKLQEWTLQEQFHREIISQPRGTIGTIQIHTGDRPLILALALYAVRTLRWLCASFCRRNGVCPLGQYVAISLNYFSIYKRCNVLINWIFIYFRTLPVSFNCKHITRLLCLLFLLFKRCPLWRVVHFRKMHITRCRGVVHYWCDYWN